MSFATNMQAVSLRLLTKYGALVTVTRPVPTTYDTATSTVGFTTATTYTGHGNPSAYTVAELANDTIKSTDMKYLFYSTTRPKIDDLVTTIDATYRVLNVDIDVVNNSDILYTLQLRI